jgi:formimidoylglutamate deiminase
MDTEQHVYLAPTAWVNGGWQQDVLLTAGADGRWARIVPGASSREQRGARRLPGPVLPGLVDGHSHAFQRAIAGLTERCASGDDDFWRWRERMYEVANRIGPGQLEAVAAFLFSELLAGGYTHVCEFHYLHNDLAGRPYADPAEMALALVRAAQRAGIGLTLLPTLYMRSGLGTADLRQEQRRFASTPDSVLRLAQVAAGQGGHVSGGVAVHSLRAVDKAALIDLARSTLAGMPLHIHIAEQVAEVEDCLARHGLRPMEFLLQNVQVDARWSLVHATQCTPAELESVRSTGAGIVLCPGTEANLGDGVFDLPSWMGRSGSWAVGSDSHVTRSWPEELRLLEYSQRLMRRRRNVAAQAALCESSAAALFQGALDGGSAAAGQPLGGLAPGQRADFVVVDTGCNALAGIPAEHLLDALVFSSPQPAFHEVFVAGQAVAPAAPAVRTAFVRAMHELWS